MKTKFLCTIICFCVFESIVAANITLSDMERLCAKTNWEEVNNFLIANEWEYYESKDEILATNQRSKQITWSYRKYYDNDYGFLAHGWFYLYTNSLQNEKPSALRLRDVSNTTYNKIIEEVRKKNYKLISSNIYNARTVVSYENGLYKLTITTSKQSRTYNDPVFGEDEQRKEEVTTWDYYIIKKGDLFDNDNGEKKIYYSLGGIKEWFFLKNGKKNGIYKEYFPSGQLQREITFRDDVAVGNAIEYNSNGDVVISTDIKLKGLSQATICNYDDEGKLHSKRQGEFEVDVVNINSCYYIRAKEEMNSHFTLSIYDHDTVVSVKKGDFNEGKGVIKTYQNGRLVESASYVDGKLDGLRQLFKYEYGKLYEQTEENYSDGQQVGIQKYTTHVNDSLTLYLTISYDEEGELHGDHEMLIERNGETYLYYKKHYSNGVPTGDFQDVVDDTLIIGHYDQDGELTGSYCVYEDPLYSFLGGLLNVDTTELNKVRMGEYVRGEKNGHWRYYDCSRYRKNVLIAEGDYIKDLENGLWKYYYPATMQKGNSFSLHGGELYLTRTYKKGILEGMTTYYSLFDNPLADSTYRKVTIKIPYKNGKKDGLYEYLDEDGSPLIVGYYKNGQKEGLWSNNLWDFLTDKSADVKCYFHNDKWSYSVHVRNDTISTYRRTDDAHYSLTRECKGKPISYETIYSSVDINHFDSNEQDIPIGAESYVILDGPVKCYDTEGNLISEGEYKENVKVGRWKYYYINQNVRRELSENMEHIYERFYSISDNQKYTGKVTFIEGQYKYVVSVKNGERNGITKIIDVNTNKTIKKEKWKDGTLQQK
ncbi:MAG: hypothetical protein J5621_08430 [Paludibacteraceae bacterium]|nr:hypothetical protein [Paludibacteraceae bacterium]